MEALVVIIGQSRNSVCFWVNRNLETCLVLALELHNSILQSEDCVVLAKANIVAWVHVCAVLADDDVTGDNLLSAELLHAKPLCI